MKYSYLESSRKRILTDNFRLAFAPIPLSANASFASKWPVSS